MRVLPRQSSRRHLSENTSHPCRLHRIHDVRVREDVSLCTVSERTGVGISRLKQQEDARSDLRLSELYRWQQALDVPTLHLLSEPELALSDPVRHRALMVRAAKTAVTILEESTTDAIRMLAQTLIAELVELMPELKDVGSWPKVDKRRMN